MYRQFYRARRYPYLVNVVTLSLCFDYALHNIRCLAIQEIQVVTTFLAAALYCCLIRAHNLAGFAGDCVPEVGEDLVGLGLIILPDKREERTVPPGHGIGFFV